MAKKISKDSQNPKNKKENFRALIKRKIVESKIVSGLNYFVNLLEVKIKNSAFYKLFTGYGKFVDYTEYSFVGHTAHTFNSSQITPIRNLNNKYKKLAENSFFINIIGKLPNYLLTTSFQSYGLFVFLFSIIMLVTNIIKNYFMNINIPYIEFALSIILLILSIPCLTTNANLSSILNSSKFVQFVLFRILGIDSIKHDESSYVESSNKHPFVMVMLAVIFGVLSIFVPNYYILLGIAALIFIMVVFARPEHGITFLFLVLPFFPTMVLAGILIVTFISFLLKVIVSKRVIKISIIDFPISLFIISIVLSGTISITGSNIKKMLLSVCFIFAYFLTKDLLRSSKIRHHCLYSLIFSSSIVSIIGIMQYILGKSSSMWLDLSKFGDIKGRVVSTFDNPNVLAEYLLVMIPITLVGFLISKSTKYKVITMAICLLNTTCLVLTWSRGAWLSFIIALLIMLVLINKKWICAYILLIPPVSVGASFASGSIVNRFVSIFTFNDTSAQFRLGIWDGIKNLIADNYLFGIGLGDIAFSKIYPLYAVSGTQAALHSHNLYLQILLEQGLLGIIVFIGLLFLFIQMSLFFRTTKATREDKLISLSIFIGILSLLLMGFTDYIWYNNRIFLLFWLLIGCGTAMLTSQLYIDRADASSIYE